MFVAFVQPFQSSQFILSGALRGAGDTLVPSIMELGSMWGVRIPLAMMLVGPLGLHGVWTAMCTDLCIRGLLFLLRMYRGRWLEIQTISAV